MKLHLLQSNDKRSKFDDFKQAYVCYCKELSAYNPDLKGKDFDQVADEEISHAMEDDTTDCILMYAEDSFLGFAIVGQSPNSYCTDDIYIQEFYVAPKYRGVGVGETAVRRIISMYYDKDVSFFVLDDNFIARTFWSVVMGELGYKNLVRTGQVKPPSAQRLPNPTLEDLVFYYWHKE